MEILTITIPTFNRQDKLLRTLNNLTLIKGNYPIRIIVIDNCSTPAVSDYLKENNYNGFDHTQILRNNGNIGMCANILLCFVHATTEWMWLLGDDDPPLSNSLSDIYQQLDKTDKRDFLIKFNSHAGGFPDHDTIIDNESDFINFCNNFFYYSNMLFMSNSIYRVKTMQKHLRVMFEFNNTLAPFMIGNLLNLNEGMRIRIVNKFVIEHGRVVSGESWDQHKVREGVLYFADLKGNVEFKNKMVRKLYLNYIAPKRFYIATFVYPFRYANYSSEYWSWFYHRSSILFSGFRHIYLNFLSSTIKFYYNSKLINTIILKRIKKKIITNLDRS